MRPSRVLRRGLLAGAVASLGSLLWPGRGMLRHAAAASAAPAEAPLVVPAWEAVPQCAPSPTDRAGQGPFFIHNDERDDDVDLFRQDLRGRYDPAAEPGTELQLHLRVLAAAGADCGAQPVQGVEVYTWHCDAQGFYSGFGEPGEQTPDVPYRFRPNQNDLDNNSRFCRGAAISDANGVVSFRSIFPGWYNGRDIHIHVMVLQRGAPARGRSWYRDAGHLYTTQLYFDPALIDRVHQASQPYRRRTTHPAYAGLIRGDEPGTSGLRMRGSVQGQAVIAQMQLVIDPATPG